MDRGMPMSRLALGTMRLGDAGPALTVPAAHKLIYQCLETGITTFEVADYYGDYSVEALLGKVLARDPALRPRMELVVRAGLVMPSDRLQPPVRVRHSNSSLEHLVRSVDRSLELLRAERVDMLVLHTVDPLTPLDEVADAVRELKKSGKVRHFGVSGYSPAQVRVLASRLPKNAPLVAFEFELSVLRPDAIFDGRLDVCGELGMRPLFASPLAGGELFRKPKSKQHQRVVRALEGVAGQISAAAGVQVSLAAVALAWLLTLPQCGSALLGTTQTERMLVASAAVTIGLTREQWYRVLEAARGPDASKVLLARASE